MKFIGVFIIPLTIICAVLLWVGVWSPVETATPWGTLFALIAAYPLAFVMGAVYASEMEKEQTQILLQEMTENLEATQASCEEASKAAKEFQQTLDAPRMYQIVNAYADDEITYKEALEQLESEFTGPGYDFLIQSLLQRGDELKKVREMQDSA